MSVRRWVVLAPVLLAGACSSNPPPKEPELSADPPAGAGAQIASAEVEQELQRAKGFLEAGKFEEARKHVDAALQRDAKSAAAHFYLGVIEEKGHKPDLAEKAYRKAVELDPKLGEAYLNLAGLLLEEPPKPEEAEALLKKALAAGVDDVGVFQNLGYARSLRKDWEGAKKAYEKAWAVANGDPMLALAYGQALLELKDKDKARGVLVAGLAKAPEDAAVLATFGRHLGPAHAFTDCVKALDRALKLKPNEPEMLVRRGTCKHDADDEPGAQADFEAAVKADPKFATAHYYLARSLLAQKKRERGLKELEAAAKLGQGTDIGKRAQDKLDELTKKKK